MRQNRIQFSPQISQMPQIPAYRSRKPSSPSILPPAHPILTTDITDTGSDLPGHHFDENGLEIPPSGTLCSPSVSSVISVVKNVFDSDPRFVALPPGRLLGHSDGPQHAGPVAQPRRHDVPHTPAHARPLPPRATPDCAPGSRSSDYLAMSASPSAPAAPPCSVVLQWCNGQPRCTLRASNLFFGDPCFGLRKRLWVRYR